MVAMEFVSVFSEATRDHEAEQRQVALAVAGSESLQSVWPFLALAQSSEEFGHRLALAEERLITIAQRHGVSYEDLTAPLVRGFEALRTTAAAVSCSNCSHANAGHARGSVCDSCGCEAFQPKTAARDQQVTCDGCGHQKAYPDSDDESRWSHSCGGTYHATKQATVHTATEPGSKGGPSGHKDHHSPEFTNNEGGHQDNAPEMPERTGETNAFGTNPYANQKMDASASLAHIASMRQALMEGQDPLTWIQQQNPPGGPQYALVPSHHDTTQSFQGQEPPAYTQAMEGEGGANAPDTPGGHSTAPKVANRPF